MYGCKWFPETNSHRNIPNIHIVDSFILKQLKVVWDRNIFPKHGPKHRTIFHVSTSTKTVLPCNNLTNIIIKAACFLLREPDNIILVEMGEWGVINGILSEVEGNNFESVFVFCNA